MAFDWQAYLGLAGDLIQSASSESENDKEACHRSAISRAYYAAHHKALEKLQALSLGEEMGRGAGIHQQVIGVFQDWKSNDGKIIGDELDQLRMWRNKADYDAAWRYAKSQFSAELKRAQRIIKGLAELK